MNTARRMENDQAKEFALGDKASLKEKLAVAFLNPLDLEKINPKKDRNLKVSSMYGEIVVRGVIDEDVTQGTILLPNSIWSNQITGIENLELKYKNIIVRLEPTEEPVTDLNKIMQKIKEG
ncbi:MAG: molybdopterin dinucleotide binding domain-containing protein [Candidatus Hodarchaeota archaeon]